MQATADQKKLIHINSPTRDMKEEFVQWATGDSSKTSTNDLTFDQANAIMEKWLGLTPHKPKFLASFDKNNTRHKYLLSLLITYGWYCKSGKYGKVANLDKLNEWLQSDKCPVPNKPLKKMNDDELTKIIGAFESMTRKKFK
jgi:hypothetical protein